MAKWMDLRHTYNLKGKLLLSCLGVVCIALGTTVCRVGNVGVDPFTAMNLGFSARVVSSMFVAKRWKGKIAE